MALDDGRVVAFAGLVRRAADPLLAEHGFTGVAASHRGRGIATLLKRSQIAWASRNGFRELMTATQWGNAPMRAINDRLGYEPRPAWIRVEAPLDEVEAGAPLAVRQRRSPRADCARWGTSCSSRSRGSGSRPLRSASATACVPFRAPSFAMIRFR